MIRKHRYQSLLSVGRNNPLGTIALLFVYPCLAVKALITSPQSVFHKNCTAEVRSRDAGDVHHYLNTCTIPQGQTRG